MYWLEQIIFCVNIRAGELCGILIWAYREMRSCLRHWRLDYMLEQHLWTLALKFCYTMMLLAWLAANLSEGIMNRSNEVYRVSQEECARLRESVPYVKVYRYNPIYLYPKLNGYGDNGRRKVGASCGSKYGNLHSWYVTWECERPWQWNAVFTVPAWRFAQSAMLRHRRAFSCIVLVTLRTTVTRVRVFS